MRVSRSIFVAVAAFIAAAAAPYNPPPNTATSLDKSNTVIVQPIGAPVIATIATTDSPTLFAAYLVDMTGYSPTFTEIIQTKTGATDASEAKKSITRADRTQADRYAATTAGNTSLVTMTGTQTGDDGGGANVIRTSAETNATTNSAARSSPAEVSLSDAMVTTLRTAARIHLRR